MSFLEILRTAMYEADGPSAFLGHVGGDDFVGIARPEVITPVCTQAIVQFDQEAARLCAAAGAPQGFLGHDRGGASRRFGPPIGNCPGLMPR